MIVKLRMTGRQHDLLKNHLFPGDGKEGVAFALCGRRISDNVHALCVRELHMMPHERCQHRGRDRVTWPTDEVRPILGKAAQSGLGFVKFHSHPTGCPRFSVLDDLSDSELLEAAQVWTDDDYPHGSIVMLPDGAMRGRWMTPHGQLEAMHVVAVAGDDVEFYFDSHRDLDPSPEFSIRNSQAFGAGTTSLLRRLSVAVIGCSGIGSLVVEQLARLGVGRLVIIDPDVIEPKNLNRIINAKSKDAVESRFKVDVAASFIREIGFGTEVEPLPKNLCEAEAVRLVAECDFVFGCMDGAEGRFLLNKLAAFYNLPYIDAGVRLEADGKGGIDQICGTVHYLQPDGSSLLSRGAITMEAIQSEGLMRTNPSVYATQVREKYISGVQEDRPAVMPVNMHYASLAVIELLARVHSFRVEGNAPFSQFGSSLTDPRFEPVKPDGAPCRVLARHVGRGDVIPLLENPYLDEGKAA